MSIGKRISRSLGTLIILWSAAAFTVQSQEITDVSEAPDADAETVVVSKPVAAGSDVTSGPAGGRVEGIMVHGHWTIEVRDPDGTLVSRREFENTLTLTGASIIANILGRNRVPGRWTIVTGAGGAPEPCGGPCVLAESTDPQTGPNVFKNLAVTVTGAGNTQLTLSGNATASGDGQILEVATRNQSCVAANQAGPAACTTAPLGPASAGEFEITSTNLSLAIDVLNGQQVQLQVILSFS